MPLVLLIALIALAAVVLAAALAYVLGYGAVARSGSLRASAAEAGDRTADLATEFFEWLRTGR